MWIAVRSQSQQRSRYLASSLMDGSSLPAVKTSMCNIIIDEESPLAVESVWSSLSSTCNIIIDEESPLATMAEEAESNGHVGTQTAATRARAEGLEASECARDAGTDATEHMDTGLREILEVIAAAKVEQESPIGWCPLGKRWRVDSGDTMEAAPSPSRIRRTPMLHDSVCYQRFTAEAEDPQPAAPQAPAVHVDLSADATATECMGDSEPQGPVDLTEDSPNLDLLDLLHPRHDPTAELRTMLSEGMPERGGPDGTGDLKADEAQRIAKADAIAMESWNWNTREDEKRAAFKRRRMAAAGRR